MVPMAASILYLKVTYDLAQVETKYLLMSLQVIM
jgi:hypothetical protein